MKKTIKLTANCRIYMTKAKMKVDERYATVIVNEEQYNRILGSFRTGKYKQMNEDESIRDLFELFEKMGKTSEKQTLLIDYPFGILRGYSFEKMCEIQKPKTDAEIEALAASLTDKYEEYLDEKLAAMDDRLGYDSEEETARQDTVDRLNEWMRQNGFAEGEFAYPLEDDEGWAIEVVDIAWPHGIYGRIGYTKPVAVQFFHTTPELLALIKKNGFEIFESVEEFKDFLDKNCRR